MSRTRRVVIAILVCLCAAVECPRASTCRRRLGRSSGRRISRAARARESEPTVPTAPPVDATLTRIDYELRVDDRRSRSPGRALLTVDVLREGWVKVPIPAGLRVRDARLDGQPLPLDRRTAVARRAVAHRTIGAVARDLAAGRRGCRGQSQSPCRHLPLRCRAPRCRCQEAAWISTVTGGFVSERSESTAESRWTALGRANQPLTFSWKRKADDRRAEMPLRFRARVASSIGLGEEVSAISSVVSVEVQQGLAREVSLAIPVGLVVNQVNGATVADWTVKGGLLTVRLLDPVATELSFVVQGESRLPADGDIAVPLVRVPAAEREIGGVAISVLGAGEIEKHQMRGLEPGDISDLADIVAGHESPSTVAFRLRPASGNRSAIAQYLRQALHAASGPHRQHRGSAVSRPRGRRRTVPDRSALRDSQQPAQLPESHAAATRDDLERVGRRQVGAAGRRRRRGRAAAARERPRRRGCADVRRAHHLPATGRAVAASPQPLDSICRRLIFRSRAPASSCITRRVFASSRSLARSASNRTRVCSPRRCASIGAAATASGSAAAGLAPPAAAALPSPAMAADAAAALSPPDEQTGKTTQFRMLIDRYRNEGGGRTVSGALPIDVSFPTMGPSLFMASELTAESSTPSIDLSVRRVR